MSRGWIVALVMMGTTGCLTRDVVLEIRAPAECCQGQGCVEPPCPLGAVRSIRTALERVDGIDAFVGCEPAPPGLCQYEDLREYVFLERVMQPSDSVDIRIEGWTDLDCGGSLALTCDSFGEHVVDLERHTDAVLFCDCPLVTP